MLCTTGAAALAAAWCAAFGGINTCNYSNHAHHAVNKTREGRHVGHMHTRMLMETSALLDVLNMCS